MSIHGRACLVKVCLVWLDKVVGDLRVLLLSVHLSICFSEANLGLKLGRVEAYMVHKRLIIAAKNGGGKSRPGK